ncbi:MAG: SGNH/GDSL hydrolase family protein [Candidatus Latescibacteria bacterium]|nr:SGNH/GDSL hydrolase family protein [Candidatus Latescibacterota bacterium]
MKKNLVLLLCSLFVSALFGEAILRLFPLNSDPLTQPDPVFGVTLIPNAKGWYVNEGTRIRISINSRGWRDHEYPDEKAPETFRILVLGDSFVEATQMPLEKTFHKLLEQRLNDQSRDGSRYEVLNFGRQGQGTAQEYLELKHQGLGLHPDLVLLCFCTSNDVVNNSRTLNGIPWMPYFAVQHDTLSLISFHSPPTYRTILRSSKFLYLLYKGITVEAGSLSGFLGAGQNSMSVDGVPLDFYVYRNEESPEWTAAWEVTKRLVGAIHRDLADRDIPFMVFTTSSVLEVEGIDAARRTYPVMNERDWDLEKPTKRLAAICQEYGIPFLPTFELFRQYTARTGRSLYVRHWNEEGHRMVADLLYETLHEEGLIPPAPSSPLSAAHRDSALPSPKMP